MVNECTLAGFGIGIFFGTLVGYIIIELIKRLKVKEVLG